MRFGVSGKTFKTLAGTPDWKAAADLRLRQSVNTKQYQNLQSNLLGVIVRKPALL